MRYGQLSARVVLSQVSKKLGSRVESSTAVSASLRSGTLAALLAAVASRLFLSRRRSTLGHASLARGDRSRRGLGLRRCQTGGLAARRFANVPEQSQPRIESFATKSAPFFSFLRRRFLGRSPVAAAVQDLLLRLAREPPSRLASFQTVRYSARALSACAATSRPPRRLALFVVVDVAAVAALGSSSQSRRWRPFRRRRGRRRHQREARALPRLEPARRDEKQRLQVPPPHRSCFIVDEGERARMKCEERNRAKSSSVSHT